MYRSLADIFELIFPSVSGYALLGMAGLLWFHRRAGTWGVVAACWICILWRVAIQIQSGRYGAMIILFGIFFASYTVLLLSEGSRRFLPPGYVPWIVLILVGGLLIPPAAKNFRHGNNSRMLELIPALQSVEKETPNALIFAEKESKRLGFYAKTTILPYPYENELQNDRDTYFRKFFYEMAYCGRPLFLLIDDSGKAPVTPADWKIAEPARLECLASAYTNPKRKKRLNLYRYTPMQLLQPWAPTPMPANNLWSNGDMEKVLPPTAISARTADRRKRSGFYRQHGLLLPDWPMLLPALPPHAAEPIPEIALTGDHALNGKYSLRIHAADHTILYLNRRVPAEAYELQFAVRCNHNQGERIAIGQYQYTAGKLSEAPQRTIWLPDNQIYKVIIRFPKPENADSILFLLKLPNGGDLMLDDFALVPCQR